MTSDTTPDERIVEAVLAGERDAFRTLVLRYKNKIFSIGYRFFYNTDDANDFCQEIFAKVYEKLATYRFNCPFRYWLGRIAYNHGINRKNKQHSRYETTDQVEIASGESLDLPVEQEELRTLVNGAIEALPQEYRICIDLYYFWGMPHREISAITGIPVNTIKSYVFRAKSLLRDTLRGTIAEEYDEI